MRVWEKLYSIALASTAFVLVFLIAISSVASASTLESTLLTMNETQITTNISDQYSPAIDENMIVWYDWRNGNPDVYMCTISGGEQETESENEAKSENEQNTGMRIPGFKMTFSIFGLLAVFLYKRK